MSLDDQLTQAFDTLAERLRGEIHQEIDRRVAEIAAAAPPPPVVVPEPVTPVEPVIQIVTMPGFDAEAAGRQHEAVQAIDRARSLTDVLDALLAAARAEASRADIFLKRGAELHQWRAPESGDERRDAPAGALVVPITVGGADVALLDADFHLDDTANVEQRTANVQLFARYASRSLEALTAFTVARALTRSSKPEAPGVVPAGTGQAASEEDTSALRYARLLVSEIKLYHETAVVDGRRDRDLATRLGGEIARARVMYEQRVPAHVRERADYFREELVRTLCNGDASLLELRT